MTGLPPLDLQMEHLDRDQYPSFRLLILVALIASAGLTMSWVTQREGRISGTVAVQSERAPIPIDRALATRLIPLRP